MSAARDPDQFPADSPQAALQAYLQAFEDEDYEAAYAFFSADVQRQMSLEEFERAATDYGTYATESRRVLYDGIDQLDTDNDETAILRLTVEVSYGDVLFADRYSYPTEVPMLREDGVWRIDQALVHLDPAPVPAPAPGD
jgi:predicted lipid-binding transport protein (Tim44 family)